MQVIYYTVALPYTFLVPMILLAVSIWNSEKGMSAYVLPDWDRLRTPELWLSAGGQVPYSKI